MKKLIALLLVLGCAFAFAACDKQQGVNAGENSSNFDMQDGEDAGIKKAKVNLANMTGKDAVVMLARKTGTKEWSDNILSQDYLHTNMAVEVSYVPKDENVYDIKLIFEDGSEKIYEKKDFDKVKVAITLD